MCSNPFLPEKKEAAFHRGRRGLSHSPGSTTPMRVPVPSLGSDPNSHHKPWWTAGEADKVAPTLALGLELGGGGEGDWLRCTMPGQLSATYSRCHTAALSLTARPGPDSSKALSVRWGLL